MEQDAINQFKAALRDFVPELVLQGLQADKREVSGLHKEIKEQLKLLTVNSIQNTERITTILNRLDTLNGKVATQEGRWIEQTQSNTVLEDKILMLSENDKTRSTNDANNISYWKDKLITAAIIMAVAVATAAGVLTIPK